MFCGRPRVGGARGHLRPPTDDLARRCRDPVWPGDPTGVVAAVSAITMATALVAFVGLGVGACTGRSPRLTLEPPARDTRLAGDAAAVAVYRAGLREVVAYVDARPDLFARTPAGAPALPPREAREAVWAAWQRFLDYLL